MRKRNTMWVSTKIRIHSLLKKTFKIEYIYCFVYTGGKGLYLVIHQTLQGNAKYLSEKGQRPFSSGEP